MPDLKRTRVAEDRFRGLRAVHTHLRGEELTQDDLNDLALLRLDLMTAVDVDERTGLPGRVRAAHLLPSTPGEAEGEETTPYAFLEAPAASQLDVDFLELINSLEDEMARTRRAGRRATVRDRAILVASRRARLRGRESMAELRELAASAGIVVLNEIIQRRQSVDPRTVLGKGKLDELLVARAQSGRRPHRLRRELRPRRFADLRSDRPQVIDRAQLILDIFATAQTSEGKIQVELAQLRYLLPRLIAGHDSAFSRLGAARRARPRRDEIGDRPPARARPHQPPRKEIESQRQRRQQRRKGRARRELPSSRLSATPTRASPRSSTAHFERGSGEQRSSPRSTRPRAACVCRANRKSSSTTPWDSSATCRRT